MWILADTHVHLYWGYDLAFFLRQAIKALEGLARELRPNCTSDDWRGVLCLVERSGQHFFRDFREGHVKVSGFRIQPSRDPLVVEISGNGHPRLYLLAGRQIVTREGLEVLGLGVTEADPDGTPASNVLKNIRDRHGLPVLAWGLGKWTFQRGRVVTRLIEEAAADVFAVGDSSLRPRELPMPRCMRLADRRGLVVLAGSDPLPPPPEVIHVGRYVSAVKATWDESIPSQCIVKALRGMSARPARLGTRSVGVEVLLRVGKHLALQKRKGRGHECGFD